MPLTRDNHYVPQLYLKHFASESGHLDRYRILVSRSDIPLWKRVNIAGVAYQSNLYTRTATHGDSDEIEQWLNREFESPAVKSICKAVNDERLEKEDYRVIVRFLASQLVRTPAFLCKNIPRWQELVPKHMEEIGRIARERLERSKETGEPVKIEHEASTAYLPMRVTREPSHDGKSVLLKTEAVVGRSMWIYAMHHLLTNTLDRLVDHRWTILSCEDDLPWFTTDDPVVAVNFRSQTDYDFNAGLCVPKVNIFMPLSPRHLLFSQVGERTYARGTVLPRPLAIMIRRMIAEHAHRYIFAKDRDRSIELYRPRVVNAEALRNEEEQWKRWHEEQSRAEREILLE